MIEITKEIFEKVLPVGMSSHEELFESLKHEIETTEDAVYKTVLGEAGTEIVEDESNTAAIEWFWRYVVTTAFLNVFRQLDLVLTPSGFGIVSNTNVSPASKQRVDALEGQLRTTKIKAKAMLLSILRIGGWGDSPQAVQNIKRICDEYWFFFVLHYDGNATYQDWELAKNDIIHADEALRNRISDAMMDELLAFYRKQEMNNNNGIEFYYAITAISDFTMSWLWGGSKAAFGAPYRRLMRILENEDNAEIFATYLNSDEYKANHVENFKNTKDSTGYLFNG